MDVESALEVIGQGVFDLFPNRDGNGKCINENDRKAVEEVNNFLDAAKESYILVQWPKSQRYMEEDWFDKEAIFCGGSEEKTGPSAYFIPIKRI